MVLHNLCTVSVQGKVRFKQPKIKDDGPGFADAGDDEFGDEFEGNADIKDMHQGVKEDIESEGDIDEELDFGVGANQGDNDQEQIQQ